MIFKSALGALTVKINTSKTWKNVFIVNYICFSLIINARLNEGSIEKRKEKVNIACTLFIPCFP